MRRKTKVKAALAVIAAVLVVGMLGVGLHYVDNLGGLFSDEDEGIDEDTIVIGDHGYRIDHNIESYLLIGTDNAGDQEAEGEDYHGQMADFLLLVVLDRTNSSYGFLHIDRNTMGEIRILNSDGSGEATFEGQLYAAHWYGGDPEMNCENTVEAVSDFLGGFPINGYYAINMGDVGALNHAVGGVKVKMDVDMSKLDPEMKEGAELTLNDKQAEIYVRARMKVGDGTNASRMTRQEEYMKAYMEKAMKKVDEDPDFINDLYEELSDRAVTNMPGNRVSAIANQVHTGTSNGMLGFEGETKEGKALGDGLYHAEFYPKEESVVSCMKKLTSMEEEF